MRKARGVDRLLLCSDFPGSVSASVWLFRHCRAWGGLARCWLAVSYPGLGDAPTGRVKYAALAGLSGQAEVLQLPGLLPVRGPALVAAVVAFSDGDLEI